MDEKTFKALNEFGITINEVFRYGFGGFASLGIACCYDPDATGRFISSLGVPLVILMGFLAGGAIYVLHCSVFGVLADLLYDWMHRLWDRWRAGTKDVKSEQITTPYYYLEKEYGVEWRHTTYAFRLVRRLFGPEDKTDFTRWHTSIYFLYLGFTVCVLSVGVAVVMGYTTGYAGELTLCLGIIGVAFFIAAIIADIRISYFECTYMKSLDKSKVAEVLRNAGLTTVNFPPGPSFPTGSPPSPPASTTVPPPSSLGPSPPTTSGQNP